VTARLLVVEDDPLIASGLARALQGNGYEVETAGTVRDALAAIGRAVPDLVLLDLGLPDGDGEQVCVVLGHEHPSVPVVVLTARGEEVDVVLGLEMGAVDYIVKPFRLAELIARIGSHLRFVLAHDDRAQQRLAAVAVVGDLTVDRAARRVLVGRRELQLRPKEFDVLERLARDAGRVVTREQLIDDVWDENWWGSTKTLDVHIHALRRKLGEEPGGPSRIVTIRGVGYRLDDEARVSG
jgi:DNA-binding response OmpR family regulator